MFYSLYSHVTWSGDYDGYTVDANSFSVGIEWKYESKNKYGKKYQESIW